MKEKKEEKKKDRFNKLHRSVKNMILMASAKDSDKAADKPGELCLCFINLKTVALADQELNFMSKDMGYKEVGFAYGLTQSLHAGNFTYQDSSTPYNLFAFYFFEAAPLQSQSQKKGNLVLHVVQTQGQGKTVAECKISAK
eukprot:12043597-Ditylum_brightwellii.AAC.2